MFYYILFTWLYAAASFTLSSHLIRDENLVPIEEKELCFIFSSLPFSLPFPCKTVFFSSFFFENRRPSLTCLLLRTAHLSALTLTAAILSCHPLAFLLSAIGTLIVFKAYARSFHSLFFLLLTISCKNNPLEGCEQTVEKIAARQKCLSNRLACAQPVCHSPDPAPAPGQRSKRMCVCGWLRASCNLLVAHPFFLLFIFFIFAHLIPLLTALEFGLLDLQLLLPTQSSFCNRFLGEANRLLALILCSFFLLFLFHLFCTSFFSKARSKCLSLE